MGGGQASALGDYVPVALAATRERSDAIGVLHRQSPAPVTCPDSRQTSVADSPATDDEYGAAEEPVGGVSLHRVGELEPTSSTHGGSGSQGDNGGGSSCSSGSGRTKRSALQDCVQVFTSLDVLNCTCFDSEVKRWVPRPYVRFLHQWRTERVSLAQNFLVLRDPPGQWDSDGGGGTAGVGGRVRQCVCLSAVVHVSVGSCEPTYMAEDEMPMPNLTSHGLQQQPLPSETIRLLCATSSGRKQKELVLWTAERGGALRLAKALAEARSLLPQLGGQTLGQFVPVAVVRTWAAEAARDCFLEACSSAEANSSPGTSTGVPTEALRAVALFVRSRRAQQLRDATCTLRRAAIGAGLRAGLAEHLALCVASVAARAGLSEALARWARIHVCDAPRPPAVAAVRDGTAPAAYGRASRALAQALVDLWGPLQAPRTALMRHALAPAVRRAQVMPMHRFVLTGSASAAGPAHRLPPLAFRDGAFSSSLTQAATRTVDAGACARCLVLAMRRCIRRALGVTWRTLACGEAPSLHHGDRRLENALDAVDRRLDEAAEAYKAVYAPAERRLGLRRLVGCLSRAATWLLAIALAQLAAAARTGGGASSSPPQLPPLLPSPPPEPGEDESGKTAAAVSGRCVAEQSIGTPSWGTPMTSPREQALDAHPGFLEGGMESQTAAAGGAAAARLKRIFTFDAEPVP